MPAAKECKPSSSLRNEAWLGIGKKRHGGGERGGATGG